MRRMPMSLCIGVLCTGVFAAQAVQASATTYFDIALEVCKKQTEAVNLHAPEVTSLLQGTELEPDDRVSEDALFAFYKHGAFVVVFAGHLSGIVKYPHDLEAANGARPSTFSEIESLVGLSHCLHPTQSDREKIGQMMTWYFENQDAHEDLSFPASFDPEQALATLMKGADGYECMKWHEASVRILAIEPGTDNAGEIAQSIFEETVGTCEKDFSQ